MEIVATLDIINLLFIGLRKPNKQEVFIGLKKPFVAFQGVFIVTFTEFIGMTP